jgi:carboxyl-terminal processing protease
MKTIKEKSHLLARTSILFLFVFIFILPTVAQKKSSNNFEASKNMEIFTTIIKELETNYVDEIKPGELIPIAIESMLEDLDPYTNYIPESQIEDYQFMTTGQYGGIGALIHKNNDYVVVSEPYANFPANKAGLQAGDIILEINGKSAKGKTVNEVSETLKGQPGTVCEVLVERYGVSKPVVKAVTREKITIDNVSYFGLLDGNIGFIRLAGFTQDASKEVASALAKLKEKATLKGLILDLRNNGGGLMNEAINIVNLFVDKGELVVSTKGKLDDKNKSYRTQFMPIDKEIPLVVLVNNNSASASEIVSGAIQDLDRGVIVGQRTFGKGLVQNVVPLAYNTQMKVTVAKYYIPSGRCIQAIDYSHKNGNGAFEKIPDSLINAFQTKNGRMVYDGGGIEPDVVLVPVTYSNIAYTLVNKFLIFDYATKFFSEHPGIPPAKDFEITDAIFDDFVNFIFDKDYSYSTKTEETLDKLKAVAEKEKYYEAIKEEFEALKSKVSHNKKDELLTYKNEIQTLLKAEIASRYYYQTGRTEASLPTDTELAKATEIINDTTQYTSLLKISSPKPEISK